MPEPQTETTTEKALPSAADRVRPGYTPRRRTRPTAMTFMLLTIGVTLGVLLRAPLVSLFTPKPAPPSPVQVKLPPLPAIAADTVRIALERAKPHLDWADEQTAKAVSEHLQVFDLFFRDVKTRTPRFSRDILSYSSKWRLVADKLPYTRTDRHAEFLRKTFSEDLFSPDQLTDVLQQVRNNYVDSINAAENLMLVKIRADVADLPAADLPQFSDGAKLRVAFDRALEEATQHVSADLRADVSREAVSAIMSEVLVLVGVRLGVSAGILGVGAGSSWATLGVGLVVAVIVDQVVSWVWDWWRDPVGDATTKINLKLDELQKLIIDGDGTSPGLRGRLEKLARDRAVIRRNAVLELIKSGGGSR